MSDLELRGLKKSFPTPQGEIPILCDVDLSMSRGEALAIAGPSGSGKSTLLYIVGTLEPPTAGDVRLLGKNPFSLPAPAVARFRNENVGFVFQDHYLLPQCSVLENVLLPALAGHGVDASAEARARSLLERVGLDRRVEYRPAELSGGQRQRVAICRALVNSPPILLADEPTGNLDRSTAQTIGTLLLEMAREQNTLLIVATHSAELAARFPRRVELVDGRLAPV